MPKDNGKKPSNRGGGGGENWKQMYQQLLAQTGGGAPAGTTPQPYNPYPSGVNPQHPQGPVNPNFFGRGPGGGRDTARGRNPYAPNYSYGTPANQYAGYGSPAQQPVTAANPYNPSTGLGNYGGQGPGGRRDTRAGINPYAPTYSGQPLAGIGAPGRRGRRSGVYY